METMEQGPDPTIEDVLFQPFDVLGAGEIPFTGDTFSLEEAEKLLGQPVRKRAVLAANPAVPKGRQGWVIAITRAGHGNEGFALLVDWCGGEVWQYADRKDFASDAEPITG